MKGEKGEAVTKKRIFIDSFWVEGGGGTVTGNMYYDIMLSLFVCMACVQTLMKMEERREG